MARVWKVKDAENPDTVALARQLLGCALVMRTGPGCVRRCRIVETEAYHGPEDRASHASRGLTPRNAVMFGPAGRWYVYLCYGVHEMLNLVTGPAGFPAAVLIRGVEGTSDPGRLTRALGIDRRFNARRADPRTGLWIEERQIEVRPEDVVAGPRVGVDHAGPAWAGRLWRFRWCAGGKLTDSAPPAGRVGRPRAA
jgi:DNA-3-methyladenine glycosylase